MTKNIYNDKKPHEIEKKLLIKGTTTTKRFQSNFVHL